MALNNEVSILNIANIDNDLKDSYTRAMIAGEEKTEYATRNYDVNEYFIWNDRRLYKTTDEITTGTAFVVSGNVKYIGNFSSQLYELFAQSPEGIKELITNVEETPNASRAFSVGEQFCWTDGFLYKVTANVSLGTLWTPGTNCAKTDNITSQIQTLDENVDSLNEALTNEVTTRAANGAHNLLPNNAISQVINGITWKVKNDGSIEAYGTASSDSVLYVYMADNSPLSFSDDCILTGCPSGGDSAKYYIRIDVNNTSNRTDVGNGVVLPKGNIYNICRCTIRSGQSIPQASPLVFKPMIRLASDTDPTYQPYAMTNRELTDAVGVKTLTPTLNSIYFNGASSISCYQIGKLVIVNVAGSTIAQIPNGNIDLTTDANLPAPIDGNYIRGFMWDATNKAILGQVRIEGKKINFPYNSAVPSGTNIRINFSYVAQ